MQQLLMGATLIDGTGAPPLRDTAVLVDDGADRGRGPRHSVAWPPDAEVIDARGMTVIPGLIDCHDHLAAHGYGLAAALGPRRAAEHRASAHRPVIQKTLAMGYTTVRDAGGLDAGFKRAIEQGLIPGPRLLLAVKIISPTGGIGDRVSPSGTHLLRADDPVAAGERGQRRRRGADVVRTMVRAGADVIKCATTGGASSRPGHGPHDAAFTLEEMKALVTESHALGRRVMCHALGGTRPADRARGGRRFHRARLLPGRGSELIPMMAEQGIFFVPTFTVYVYHREVSPPHVRVRAHDLDPHHVESLHRALEAGVKIGAGTDAGGHGHPINARELQCLVEAGMSPMQALQAATGWAAECLGLEREVGTIEKGRLADLVVVNGDPLEDITVLQDLHASSWCSRRDDLR